MQVRVLHSHFKNMYWIPLVQINNNWTGIACPLPLQKDWINFFFFNNHCKIKGKTYKLATEKIFTTPSTNCKPKPYLNSFDTSFTNNFNSLNGIKISLSGRLKGISKAKRLVITHGVIRPQSIDNKLDYYARPIYTKWGTIGLKVIC